MKSTNMPAFVSELSWTDNDVQAVSRKYADSAAKAAVKIWEDAVELDADLTADMVNIATECALACIGLDQRIESPLKLRETILDHQGVRASVHGNYRTPPATVIDHCGGPFRFTLVMDSHDRLTHTAVQLVHKLQIGGWTVDDIAHSYRDQSLLKAFVIIATHPNGGRTRIRLHSDDSIAAEELAAHDWQIYTEPNRPVAERRAAKEQCQDSAALVPHPEGLDRITAIGGVTVSIKRYS